MNMCLSICIPEEIWITIIGNSGLVLQQLFMVNKRINMYLEKIKKQFIKHNPIYSYYGKYVVKNMNPITIIKCDNNTCNIKYNNKYTLNMDFNNDINFKSYNNNEYTLNMNFNNDINFKSYNHLTILMIYNLKIIKYVIYNKILYDMENYILPDDFLGKSCNYVNELIQLVCDQASCGKDIAKFGLIYYNFDVVQTILFITSRY